MSFFTGTPERWEQKSILDKRQKPGYHQLLNAGQREGAGGAFGDAADYYRSLLGEENPTFNALAAPEQRRFNEQTIPDLAEQFAGWGGREGGGLSGSGFRNAAVNAGTDLAERLGAIRAQLRQQGAAGLTGIGELGLRQYNENIHRPGTEGFLSSAIGPAIGAAATAFGGPVVGALGTAAGNWLSNKFGNSSPYGGGNNSTSRGEIANWKAPASPNVNFMQRPV